MDEHQIAAWWTHLPDMMQDALMDDPGRRLTGELLEAVKRAAGSLHVDASELRGDDSPADGPRLSSEIVAFVRDRAAERDAALGP